MCQPLYVLSSCSPQPFWYFVDYCRHDSYEFLSNTLFYSATLIMWRENARGAGRTERHDSCFLSDTSFSKTFSLWLPSQKVLSPLKKKKKYWFWHPIICPVRPKSPEGSLSLLKSLSFWDICMSFTKWWWGLESVHHPRHLVSPPPSNVCFSLIDHWGQWREWPHLKPGSPHRDLLCAGLTADLPLDRIQEKKFILLEHGRWLLTMGELNFFLIKFLIRNCICCYKKSIQYWSIENLLCL